TVTVAACLDVTDSRWARKRRINCSPRGLTARGGEWLGITHHRAAPGNEGGREGKRDREVTMSATEMDEAKLEEFMGLVTGYMIGGSACFGVWLGDELGMYSTVARNGPCSADQVAADAGTNPRLTREWLDGQAAAGLVD